MRISLHIVSMEIVTYLDLLSVVIVDILHNRAYAVCIHGLLPLFGLGLL